MAGRPLACGLVSPSADGLVDRQSIGQSVRSYLSLNMLKVVIITDLGSGQETALHAENITDLPKTLQVPYYVVFHDLESQNAGLLDVKKGLY